MAQIGCEPERDMKRVGSSGAGAKLFPLLTILGQGIGTSQKGYESKDYNDDNGDTDDDDDVGYENNHKSWKA